MANKTDLVFDFSNMAMRAIFTCSYAGMGSVSTFDTDEECAILIRKIAMDMAYVMRIFNPDRVIIACDARHPWRNDIYKNIENETYKGNREKDTTKNWDKIFTTLNEYKKILEQKNFIVTELNTAEADDLAALWKQCAFNNSNNIILVSSDKDWTQLVEFDKNNNKFCICFNPIANNKGKKKLFVTEEFVEWVNSETTNKNDIFFTSYNSYKDNVLNKIKTKDTKIDFEIINPAFVLLDKIMCGDDGDNAPSIYEFYKNGKKTRMTPGRCKKMYDILNIHNIGELCQATAAGALLEALSAVFKFDVNDIDPDERLMRQRKLVELNPLLFPEEICKSFNYHVKDVNDNSIGYIQTTAITLNEILKDTKFLTEDYNSKKPKEAGIFDNLKDLDKFINHTPTSALF